VLSVFLFLMFLQQNAARSLSKTSCISFTLHTIAIPGIVCIRIGGDKRQKILHSSNTCSLQLAACLLFAVFANEVQQRPAAYLTKYCLILISESVWLRFYQLLIIQRARDKG